MVLPMAVKRPSPFSVTDNATAVSAKKRKVKLDDEAWNANFAKLIKYKEKHGNYLVPQKFKEDTILGAWVSTQRMSYKNKNLPEDRRDKLNAIGFVWNIRPKYEPFDSMCDRLAAYKKENGNCKVPTTFQKDPKLARWVNMMRHLKSDGRLPPDRFEKLDSIGFVWSSAWESFHSMFEQLLIYKDENGHCKVPQTYPKDPKLGRWVSTQRRLKKKGKLSQEKIRKLESVGFLWSARESAVSQENQLSKPKLRCWVDLPKDPNYV